MRIFEYVLLLLLMVQTSYSQENPRPLFTVFSLPEKLQYSKALLNKEIAQCKTKEEVRKILKDRGLITGRISFSYQKSPAQLVRWTILNDAKLRETDDDQILIQSKDIKSQRISHLDDFSLVYKDTLLLLFPHQATLFLHNTDYPSDQFMIKDLTKGGRTYPIPVVKGALIISPEMFEDPDLLHQCKIFNRSRETRFLASFYIGFINKDDKVLLQDLNNELIASNAASGIEERVELIWHFARLNIGPIDFVQLQNWLEHL